MHDNVTNLVSRPMFSWSRNKTKSSTQCLHVPFYLYMYSCTYSFTCRSIPVGVLSCWIILHYGAVWILSLIPTMHGHAYRHIHNMNDNDKHVQTEFHDVIISVKITWHKILFIRSNSLVTNNKLSLMESKTKIDIKMPG